MNDLTPEQRRQAYIDIQRDENNFMANAANSNVFNNGAIESLNAEIAHIKAMMQKDQNENNTAKANQKNNSGNNNSNGNSANGKANGSNNNGSNSANGSNADNGVPGSSSIDGFNIPYPGLNGDLIPGMNGYDPYGNGYGLNGSPDNPNAMNGNNLSSDNDPQDKIIQEKQKELNDLQNGQGNDSDDLNTFDQKGNSDMSDANPSDTNATDPSDAYHSGYEVGKRKLRGMNGANAHGVGNTMNMLSNNTGVGTGQMNASTSANTTNGYNGSLRFNNMESNDNGISSRSNTDSSNSGNGRTLPKTGESDNAKAIGSIAMTLGLLGLLGADSSRKRRYNE